MEREANAEQRCQQNRKGGMHTSSKNLWHVRILCPGSKLPLFLLNGKFGRFRFRDEFVRHSLFDDICLRLHNVELRFDGRFLVSNSRYDCILYYQLGIYSVIDLSIHPSIHPSVHACMY